MKNTSLLYKLLITLLLPGVLVAAGCGYRFSGGGTLPPGTGDICISIFENLSSESSLENSITNDVIYEFTRNGQSVVRSESDSDSVMNGIIMSVSTESSTRSTNLTSDEKKVKVYISVALKNRKGSVLWENSELRYEQTYLANIDNEAERANRKEALVKLSKRFAPALYARMTEKF